MQRASAGFKLKLPVVIPPPTGNPGLAGPGTVGCRIPRDQLIKTTEAEAAVLTDLTGRLIEGKLVINMNGVVGQDFIVEARGNHSNLIEVKAGGNSANFEYITVSGLQLDDNSNPVRAHEINAGLWGPNLKVKRAELMYINDGFRIASNSSLTESYVHAHTRDYSSAGDEQHRDGTQSTRGGSIRVEDNLFDNRASPCPFPDGTWVGTYSKAASSSMITNHDAPYTGWVRFNRNRSIGGSSVHVNLIGGLDDGDITGWTIPVYDSDGILKRGFECKENISLEDPQYTTIICSRAWKYFGFIDASNRRFDENGVEGPWTVMHGDSFESGMVILDINGLTIQYRRDISLSAPHEFSLTNTPGTITSVIYRLGRTTTILGQTNSAAAIPIDLSVLSLSDIPYGVITLRCEYEYTDSSGATIAQSMEKSVQLIA